MKTIGKKKVRVLPLALGCVILFQSIGGSVVVAAETPVEAVEAFKSEIESDEVIIEEGDEITSDEIDVEEYELLETETGNKDEEQDKELKVQKNIGAEENIAEYEEVREARWFVFDQDTNTITGYSQDPSAPTDIVIPTQINGVDVLKIADFAFLSTQITSVNFEEDSKLTEIGIDAFKRCSKLSTVNLPNSLEKLNRGVFYECKALTEITIPNNVTDMGSYTFGECTALEKIAISESVETLGSYMFNGCTALTEITIPDNVFVMKDCLFKDCTSLTSIVLSNNLTQIGGYAFEKCINLKAVEFPNTLTDIGEGSFTYCSSLKEIDLPEGIKVLRPKVFNECTGLVSVKIPEGVTKLEGFAFYNCKSLTSISLPESLIEIGVSAFNRCGRLSEITIPKNVKKIGNSAFYLASALKYIRIPDIKSGEIEGAPWGSSSATVLWKNTQIVDEKYVYEWFSDKNIGTITKFIGAGNNLVLDIAGDFERAGVTTPVTNIGESAFSSRYSINSVVLPDTVTIIEENAFSGCRNLETVKFSDTLKEVKAAAFSGCYKLKSLELSDCLTVIGENAFSSCGSLETVKLPKNLEKLGERAFDSCGNLTEITIMSKELEVEKQVFWYCDSLKMIKIPEIEKDGIKGAPWSANNAAVIWKGTQIVEEKYVYEWNEEKETGTITKYIGTDTVLNIKEDFEKAGITTPVTGIGEKAFYKSEVVGLEMPDTVIEIEGEAFYASKQLVDLKLSNKVKQIGRSAFGHCEALTEVSLPSVEVIGNNAFRFCKALTEVSLPKQINKMGSSVFEYCEALTSISVPVIKGSCEFSVFYGCTSLEKVEFQEGTTKIYSSMFDECTSLSEIVINDGIKEIGDYAFRDCKSLNDIILPESITKIGNEAFMSCTGLSNIILPEGITEIKRSTFSGCTGLENIVIPKSVTSIGEEAFKDTAIAGEFKLSANVKMLGENIFSGVKTLDKLIISYSRQKCPYIVNEPYGLDTTITEIVYNGGKPEIEHIAEKQENGSYKLDFNITFKTGETIVDGVTYVILPNTDGTAGTYIYETGGRDIWSTADTGNSLYVTKKGTYIVQVAGLDGIIHPYGVYIGEPVIEKTEFELYTEDLKSITKEQILYMLDIADKDGNIEVYDEFGDVFENCFVNISEEDIASLRKISDGESKEIAVEIGNNEYSKVFKIKVNSSVVSLKGKVIWNDEEDKNACRPEQISVDVIKNNSEKLESITVTADETGEWRFTFTGAPKEMVEIGGVVGSLHIGDKVDYSIECPEVWNYTTTITKDSKTQEYEITNTYDPQLPFTGVETGNMSMSVMFLAVLGMVFGVVRFIRKKLFI